jgi:ATP-dependent protease HslVU (ClpYQ) peptidase subunit
MWINMSKSEIQKLKKYIALVGFTSTGADVPLAQLRDKLDEALQDEKNPVLRAYRRRAKKLYKEGELEIDDDAVVSHGDDHGAYVMAWVWVEDEDEKEDDKVPSGDGA